jgi:hypothetical protein
MEILEIVKCMRWFVGRLSHIDQKTVGKVILRIDSEYLKYEYRLLVNLLSLLPAIKCKDRARMVNLIVKIYNRIQETKKVEMHPHASEGESSKLKEEVEGQSKVSNYRKLLKKKLEED